MNYYFIDNDDISETKTLKMFYVYAYKVQRKI